MIRYHLECDGCRWWTLNNQLTHCRYCETPLRASRPSDNIRRGIAPSTPMTRRDVKAWIRHRSTKTRKIQVTTESWVTIMRPSTAELRRWVRSKSTPVPVRMFCWNALRYRQSTRT